MSPIPDSELVNSAIHILTLRGSGYEAQAVARLRASLAASEASGARMREALEAVKAMTPEHYVREHAIIDAALASAPTERNREMTWTPDICIHHHPCDDGFCSAWIARKRWPGIEIVGTNYGLAFPSIDITGKNLLIADFSYKPEVLADLATRAKSIVMLDHHKTAEADLTDFQAEMCGGAKFVASDIGGVLRDLAELNRPPIIARFDMERSGASLTWEFCFPEKPAPVFVQFIEDRDLWRFRLKETRAFSLYLRSFPMEFEAWDQLADRVNDDLNLVMGEALSIERFYDRKLAEMVPTATVKSIGKWDGVPVAHAPYAFASDLAHELLKTHPNAPFAAVVVDAYGGRTYSLRSEDARQDVSEVARMFGGGGHRNAAGFRVPA